jgi:hypothetical protein
LARVIRANDRSHIGAVVMVLHQQPDHCFALPDGYWHVSARIDGPGHRWVVRYAEPMRVPTDGAQGYRVAAFATFADTSLEPIAGHKAEPEAMPTAADKPQTVEV